MRRMRFVKMADAFLKIILRSYVVEFGDGA